MKTIKSLFGHSAKKYPYLNLLGLVLGYVMMMHGPPPSAKAAKPVAAAPSAVALAPASSAPVGVRHYQSDHALSSYLHTNPATAYSLLRNSYNNSVYIQRNGSIVNTEFFNHHYSRFSRQTLIEREYLHGYGFSYRGQISPWQLPLEYFLDAGYSPAEANIMRLVSTVEGNMDALNNYDGGGLSMGFIQFAGLRGGGLSRLLALAHHREKDLYQRLFGRYGVGIHYQLSTHGISQAELSIMYPQPGGGIVQLRGNEAAYEFIRRNDEMLVVFMSAFTHPEISRMQLIGARLWYADPAIEIGVNVNIGGREQLVPLISIMRSQKSWGAIVMMTVNAWTTGTRASFERALQMAIQEHNIRSLEALKQLPEEKVLVHLQSDVRHHTRKIADLVLSSTELGSSKWW